MPTLLVELFTEELPPKALPRLAAVFADTIHQELANKQLCSDSSVVHRYASPRRLAVTISDVAAVGPAQTVSEKLMPVTVALDAAGQPTPALLKKLQAKNLSADIVAQCERRPDGKSESLFYTYTAEGSQLNQVLSAAIDAAVKKLPIPKVMRWGDSEVTFVRPVHRLVCLHGEAIVPAQVLGLQSGRITGGHRFLSKGEISIPSAEQYARTLHDQGRVIASFEARRELIRHKLQERSQALQATLAADDALLDEVTALVEWPVVLEAGFEADFLKVPQECLILTMQQNQKYFPLLDQQQKLINRFLLVSNLESDQPQHIIHGNERVLRARLSDARFFFEQDQKAKLDSRLPRLAEVVYHNKIGNQLQRIERIEALAGEIAGLLGADVALARRAGRLAKADLVSEMVGEFPELQGIMGMYYARLDGEDEAVAAAIEAHYHPRFAGDTLPQGPIALSVALADKLETLAGIWGIGLIPTGDKDPFGLRRQALGVLRMLVEAQLPLDLSDLLQRAVQQFPAGLLAADTASALYGFALERLKNLLAAEHRADEIDAVLALSPRRLDQLTSVLAAVSAFRSLPEASTLAAANKRVKNILKKVEGDVSATIDPDGLAYASVTRHVQRISKTLDPSLLSEAAEQALAAAIAAIRPEVDAAVAAGNYQAALSRLAALKAPVDSFFEQVMVMADDEAVRRNRLALLAQLSGLFNQVADISLLAD